MHDLTAGSHINALNKASDFFAKLRGLVISPAEQILRRMERQAAREAKRSAKHASYPYSSTRQNTRELRKRLRAEAAFDALPAYSPEWLKTAGQLLVDAVDVEPVAS